MHRAILYLLLTTLIGCASMPATRPDYCLDQKSYILDLADQLKLAPENLSAMLIIANLEALKHSPLYSVDACRGALQNIRVLLSAGAPTYYEVITLASENVDYVNRYAGAEVMLVGLFVPRLSDKAPITDCDRRLILAHLDQQEAMLTTFFSGKSSWLGSPANRGDSVAMSLRQRKRGPIDRSSISRSCGGEGREARGKRQEARG